MEPKSWSPGEQQWSKDHGRGCRVASVQYPHVQAHHRSSKHIALAISQCQGPLQGTDPEDGCDSPDVLHPQMPGKIFFKKVGGGNLNGTLENSYLTQQKTVMEEHRDKKDIQKTKQGVPGWLSRLSI